MVFKAARAFANSSSTSKTSRSRKSKTYYSPPPPPPPPPIIQNATGLSTLHSDIFWFSHVYRHELLCLLYIALSASPLSA